MQEKGFKLFVRILKYIHFFKKTEYCFLILNKDANDFFKRCYKLKFIVLFSL